MKSITVFGQNIGQINEITNLIKCIADQINSLALNVLLKQQELVRPEVLK